MVTSTDLIVTAIAGELSIEVTQVQNTLKLLANGNTIPFITRYRKDTTGGLDEVILRKIYDRANYLRKLSMRKRKVLNEIKEQDQLTPELSKKIREAITLEEVNDLFRPFSKDEETKAAIARKQGLEPLAQMIFSGSMDKGTGEEITQQFVNEDLGIASPKQAIAGAIEIVTEMIANKAEIWPIIREVSYLEGIIQSQGDERSDPERKFQQYHNYQDSLSDIPSHRLLAINRGDKLGALQVKLLLPETKIIDWLQRTFVQQYDSIFLDELEQAIEQAFYEHILPQIRKELKRKTKKMAEVQAYKSFATNLRKLLLKPPFQGLNVMGIDPGFRTGCKIAIVDKTGKFLHHETIFPHPPVNNLFEAKEQLHKLVKKYYIGAVAIGDGTASRQTEELIAEIIQESPRQDLGYILLSEAGASVYSVSEIARKEFPELDPTIRSAIHIARRLIDPLSELVKVEPKSLGIGLYQHDVNQERLAEVLQVVVESCVNQIGVNVNSASIPLLENVSGIDKELAEAIVTYREQNGKIHSRQELLKVPGMTAEIFKQAAGFLKVFNGKNILDQTFIHPESYDATLKLLSKIDTKPEDYQLSQKISALKAQIALRSDLLNQLIQELDIGLYTLKDILKALERPRFDPRDELPKTILQKKAFSLKDLKPGMILEGRIKNVVDFGAFVDIGLKTDGLLHISELSENYISNPYQVVTVGDPVIVKVLSIDVERERISLSMKGIDQEHL
ncbi:MAG: S1 RNA-binding domain-containing protein [Candidatus Heimdallarchaeota archaeon]|nr:S1 RNA-binding domain-containing protein [Candidatus Heimdallarchaeota archaeon]